MSACCSAAEHSKNVGTTRRVITSTCPGDTGNESKIAKQRSFAHTHSASGISRNGEGAADSMAGSLRITWSTLVRDGSMNRKKAFGSNAAHGAGAVANVRYSSFPLEIET